MLYEIFVKVTQEGGVVFLREVFMRPAEQIEGDEGGGEDENPAEESLGLFFSSRLVVDGVVKGDLCSGSRTPI